MRDGNPFSFFRRIQLPGPHGKKKHRAKTMPIKEDIANPLGLMKILRASDRLKKPVKMNDQNGPVTAPKTMHFASINGNSHNGGSPSRMRKIDNIHLMTSFCVNKHWNDQGF